RLVVAEAVFELRVGRVQRRPHQLGEGRDDGHAAGGERAEDARGAVRRLVVALAHRATFLGAGSRPDWAGSAPLPRRRSRPVRVLDPALALMSPAPCITL